MVFYNNLLYFRHFIFLFSRSPSRICRTHVAHTTCLPTYAPHTHHLPLTPTALVTPPIALAGCSPSAASRVLTRLTSMLTLVCIAHTPRTPRTYHPHTTSMWAPPYTTCTFLLHFLGCFFLLQGKNPLTHSTLLLWTAPSVRILRLWYAHHVLPDVTSTRA